MADWGDLARELDAWREAEQTATFWWRDDDAAAPAPQLEALLKLHDDTEVPLALAVIPARADDELAPTLLLYLHTYVLQHGFAHENHAPEGEKKAELGDHRPSADVLDELWRGRARLEALFGPQFLPVLVPPWNRIGARTADQLAQAGYHGLSTFKPRHQAIAPAAVVTCNTHVDILDWRGSRGFRGEDAVLDQAVAHLKARRTGEAAMDEPTGLISHHLVHDESCWRFMAEFMKRTADHKAAYWLNAREVFRLS